MDQRGAGSQPSLRQEEASRLFALASEYHRQGRTEEAVQGYVRALAMDPDLADAYNNLGVIMRGQRKFGAAIACYRRAIALGHDSPGTRSNLGNALRDAGRLEEAIAEHRKAVALGADSAPTLYNLGLALRDLGQHETALACFEKAIALREGYVDCLWDRALTLLQMGRLTEGFAEYEWRWKLPDVRSPGLAAPAWDGSALGGRTLFLYQEQGFGDLIQFIRYVPLIPRDGGQVVVSCQPELIRLFAGMPGIDRLVTVGAAMPQFDVQAPLLSLPRLLGTTADTIPAQVPYLEAPRVHGLHLAGPPGQLKVAIAWAGKPTHKNDRNRSCPLEHFVGLLEVPGVTFYAIQKGPRARDIARWANDALIADLGPKLNDFADTAAVLSQVDLVISVDTAVVHLAGAMNRPVWVVLPFASDWRWGISGETTPWYPSMRLFRQPRPGDWAAAFDGVKAALAGSVAPTAAAAAD